jgi:hypothetical protein
MVYNIGILLSGNSGGGAAEMGALPGALPGAVDLDDPQQIQHNEDQHDHEQNVNGVARTRKAFEDIRTEIPKQPQYEQDYDDPGKHDVSPFCWRFGPVFILHLAFMKRIHPPGSVALRRLGEPGRRQLWANGHDRS